MRLNKKIVPYILIIMFVLGGCDEGPKPSLKNTTDASLEVASDGSVSLRTEHRYEDGNVTTHTQSIKETEKNTGYEKVPNFVMQSESVSFEREIINSEKVYFSKKDDKVKIAVESIPLNEFIDLVFSTVLKKNYTLGEVISKMTNSITLNMSEAQSKEDFYNVIEKILFEHGVKIELKDGVLFIDKAKAKSENIADEGIYIGYGRELDKDVKDDEVIMMYIPFYYIQARDSSYIYELSGILGSKYWYYKNSIQIVKNSAKNIRKILEVVKLIDQPYMQDKMTFNIKFEHIDVKNFLERIKILFKANGIALANLPSDSGILLEPIEEINSLFVITPKKEWLKMLLFWKEKLDVVSEVSSETKFYTYKVKNRKADELAEAVNSVLAIKLASLQQNKIQDASSKTADKSIDTQKNSDRKIVADLPTNTLMMEFLPLEYRELLPLIEELDALPLQVLAEVTLAEVTLTDTFSLGFEYAIRNAEAASPIADIELASAVFGGSGFAATYASKRLDATINAYAEDKLLSILSKPKILILNNETGSINVGTQIPIITSENSAPDTTNASTSSIMRNISYRNTGVAVGLTPTINSNGVLTMSVTIQLSEAQLNDTSGIDSPLIVNRSLSTTLTINDGESVMLGGLISKNKSTTQSGVPLLRDIPWLGTLFASQSDKVTKTELIILIKPYIIKKPDEGAQRTQSYTKVLKLLKKYSLF